jgi:hypothetical protein
LRSSSAAYARRWVLTHKPKAGSPANSVGTLAWSCFFTNCRSAAKRLSRMSGFTTHSNLMFCSFLMRATLIRMGPNRGLLPFLDGFLGLGQLLLLLCSLPVPRLPALGRLRGGHCGRWEQAAAAKKCWLDGAGAKCTVTNAQMR